jgi:hypothetical protein
MQTTFASSTPRPGSILRNPWCRFLPACVFCLFSFAGTGRAIGQDPWVESAPAPGSFSLVQQGAAAPLYVDSQDFPGVIRATDDLKSDIARVTNVTPAVIHQEGGPGANVIIIGTLGKSRLLDRLIQEGRLEAAPIAGKWESFIVQVVPNPLPGVASGLVIAGSDKRGTIYGIYALSEQIGVSPWYWWADVPVAHRDALFVKPGRHVEGEPAVRYRGIFLNDEAPALTGWVNEKFGGYNHRFYVKVFELLLRLKANYLWPAMWASAFNEDDPLNPKLADDYGIVMGTSHHEPMLRAQQEWKRHGHGPWNYATNREVLRPFWDEGIGRNKNYESIITLGMRGDGDLPMSAESNLALLERIVTDQRDILARNMPVDVTRIPQLWALYKEVQEYYEKGMRVPDDVTLLWCDDNWGNLRRLPTAEERKRRGGAGIYYHFDYVGGPRSYKWLNTVPLSKIWEQMNLAYRYGADRIWIVNVGDLKPLEFPLEFFLTLAWNPDRWPKEKLGEYGRLWAEREFGPKYAADIAEILTQYTKYNGRRTPELLAPDTYSLVNYHEAETIVADYKALAERAERLSDALPPAARDAFFELVLYPVKAGALVNELQVTAGLNRLYAGQGRISTNALAARARALFYADAALARTYNNELAGGKWRHLMDQTHLGYTSWQQPVRNALPAVTELQVPMAGELGVAVEGSVAAWPTDDPNQPAPVLPALNAYDRQTRFIDVFTRGRMSVAFTAEASEPWLRVTPAQGKALTDLRITVDVDWPRAPVGSQTASVTIRGAEGRQVVIAVPVFNPALPPRDTVTGFVETDGCVSIEAAHYTRKIDAGPARWENLPEYGRTLSAMTVFPVTTPGALPPRDTPCLEYTMYLFHAGTVEVAAFIAPTLNFVPGRGLRFAVSFDDQPPRTVDALAQASQKEWETSVENSIRIIKTSHTLRGTGYHVLKFWMVDPGVVLEKLVVNLGGVRPSYLGPPESYRQGEPPPVQR